MRLWWRRRKKKTLVIVGNSGEPVGGRGEAELRREIDACDVVVRFNEIKNRNRNWIGSRTDILFMRNEGATAHRIANTPLEIAPAMIPREIVFSMGPEAHGIVGDPRPDLADPHRSRLYDRQMRAKPELLGLPHCFVETQLVLETYALLKRRAGGQTSVPTLGLLAIQHFLQSPAHRDHTIKLTGLTFEGWRGHAWALEEEIVGELVDAGRVSWL